ncbi:hypothetical protein RFI_14054 [Reticulomyxa filosa]|uniref:Uncharacterized protein n=1 Tax=Reticulomyxa filosa TaxID=46433 RepID=X6NB47_RETFI|nr:hypothetical protein RFI_14054 [Reticulomyxa filosa]|eukprot:ETO23128.1 hypothetical protein RFI_14054 [Reticulomyxa filosa]
MEKKRRRAQNNAFKLMSLEILLFSSHASLLCKIGDVNIKTPIDYSQLYRYLLSCFVFSHCKVIWTQLKSIYVHCVASKLSNIAILCDVDHTNTLSAEMMEHFKKNIRFLSFVCLEWFEFLFSADLINFQQKEIEEYEQLNINYSVKDIICSEKKHNQDFVSANKLKLFQLLIAAKIHKFFHNSNSINIEFYYFKKLIETFDKKVWLALLADKKTHHIYLKFVSTNTSNQRTQHNITSVEITELLKLLVESKCTECDTLLSDLSILIRYFYLNEKEVCLCVVHDKSTNLKGEVDAISLNICQDFPNKSENANQWFLSQQKTMLDEKKELVPKPPSGHNDTNASRHAISRTNKMKKSINKHNTLLQQEEGKTTDTKQVSACHRQSTTRLPNTVNQKSFSDQRKTFDKVKYKKIVIFSSFKILTKQ